MKFDKRVPREARKFLTQQLKEYEQTTKTSNEERRLLHEWVAAGHSPYENGDYIYGAGGLVDFISALHIIQEMDEWYNDLSEEGKQEELSGCIQYDTKTDSITFDVNFLNLPDIPDEELPFH